jgi:predicted metal-dependent hydrolase
MIPARMSRSEEREWVTLMLQRLDAQDRRARPSDAELLARARRLSRDYIGDRAVAASVRWVDNQRSRWGSCTIDEASIRLSSRMKGMPDYVIDYVLVHELAHLVEPGHNARFWQLVDAYPRTERARGFLEGVAATAQLSIVDD